MDNLINKKIEKIRNKIKKGPVDKLLMQKPFADGMYRFCMFIIDYYARVKEQIGIDYDSFMIIQVTVSLQLYSLNKKKTSYGGSYEDIEKEFNKVIDEREEILDIMDNHEPLNKSRLTISSICLVINLPKETVRRKVNALVKRNFLKISKKYGITVGSAYKKVFKKFVPKTAYAMAGLLQNWKKSGVLNSFINFEI